MFQKIVIAGVVALCAGQMQAQLATKMRPETLRAFDAYVATTETSIQRRIDGKQPFLWVTESRERRDESLQGEIVTHKFETNNVKVPGGLIHDWIGAMFIPSASAEQVITILQDFDRHKDYYPEVLESRLLSRQGDVVRSFLRLRKEKVITVVLDTEHEARYKKLTDKRWTMRSYSNKIAEVKDAGEPGEHQLPVGEDSGFLWRLNAYWRIEEVPSGVWVELRTLSLTRDIPLGVGWIVRPFTSSIPRESLTSTLQGTRMAVKR